MSGSVYRRMGRLLFRFWPYIIISSLSAIIFVLLNSTSMWLVASLINNVLQDFDKIVQITKSKDFKIGIRYAIAGESFIGLNDEKYTLNSKNLIITD